MRVRATKLSFIEGNRRREGEHYSLANPKNFNKRVMEKLDDIDPADLAKPQKKDKPEKPGKGKAEPTGNQEVI